MSKYMWLNDYRDLEDEVAILELNLERTKKELKRWVAGDLAKVKLSAESNASQLEEIIEDLEYRIADKMNDMHDILSVVKTFKGLEHQILMMKYVEGKTLEEIADEMKYSYTYVKQKHAEIMRILKYCNDVNKK